MDGVMVKGNLGSACLGDGNNALLVMKDAGCVITGSNDDRIVVEHNLGSACLGNGINQVYVGNNVSCGITGGSGQDSVYVKGDLHSTSLGCGDDILQVNGASQCVNLGFGDDSAKIGTNAGLIDACFGNDTVIVQQNNGLICMSGGNDTLTLDNFANKSSANGGCDNDTLNIVGSATDFKVEKGLCNTTTITELATGDKMTAVSFEQINFIAAAPDMSFNLGFVQDVYNIPCFGLLTATP